MKMKCALGLLIRMMTTAAVVSAYLSISSQEMEGLEQLFLSTGGDSWSWKSEEMSGARWNFTKEDGGDGTSLFLHDPCSSNVTSHSGGGGGGVNVTWWEGIACSGEPDHCRSSACSVLIVDLSDFNLQGPLPSAIGLLTNLRALHLSSNYISGSIPSELSSLTDMLSLRLNSNQLSDSIPSGLSSMSFLLNLYLYSNQLTGSIPMELCLLSPLRKLYLDSNLISGAIPSEIASLSFLNYLDLQTNAITGTIPVQIESLTDLIRLSMYENYLTGSLPLQLSSLVSLKVLYAEWNQLSASLPTELSTLQGMKRMAIFNNRLTGSIPPEYGQMFLLERLELHVNYLTGTIPSELGTLSYLSILQLYRNHLTGTIPPATVSLPLVEVLYFNSNLLTGTIPDLGKMSLILWLFFNSNDLSGTIPQVSGLSSVQALYLDSNDLSGPVPPAMATLTTRRLLLLSNNQLTGTIPSKLTSLSLMQAYSLSFNLLTGTLPQLIGSSPLLTTLSIASNMITGSIPDVECLTVSPDCLARLQKLEMETNKLTGAIPSWVGSASNAQIIDLSDNFLTGSIPQEILSLQQLATLSLSVNCLDHEIPEAICLLENIEVLSLNGLGGADGCSNALEIPLFKTRWMGGQDSELPSCLWSMPRLITLHVTGNGLLGDSTAMTTSGHGSLQDLSLSHNRLDGTIPDVCYNIKLVDLSYNRLDGHIVTNEWRNRSNESILIAEVNRLSGPLTSSELGGIAKLNILRGNMFSCDSLPGNDENRFGYECGSSQYDYSLWFSVGAFVAAIGYLACCLHGNSSCARSTHDCESSGTELAPSCPKNFVSSVGADNLDTAARDAAVLRVVTFCRRLRLHIKFMFVLMMVVLVGTLPMYSLRLGDSDGEYSTHWDVYSWLFSFAFMRGEVMGDLAVSVWALGTLTFLFYIIFCREWCRTYICGSGEGDGATTRKYEIDQQDLVGESEIESESILTNVKVAVALMCNFILTGGVNVLYVLCITELSLSPIAAFSVQFSMSVFRVISPLFLLPALSAAVKNPVHQATFRLHLLLFNNMFIPCVVVALTSPNCFQELLVEPDAITTMYTYRFCMFAQIQNGVSSCIFYNTLSKETVPFVPAFSYGYQCSSSVQSAYIPVILLGCSLQLVLHTIFSFVMKRTQFASVPSSFRLLLPGILWPEYWHGLNDNDDVLSITPVGLFKTPAVICFDVLHPVAMVMTFGLCSPAVTFMLTAVSVLKMHNWSLLLLDFCMGKKAVSEKLSVKLPDCVVVLSEVCDFSVTEAIEQSFGVILFYSLLLMLFIYWDTVARIGWEVPVTAAFFSCAMMLVHKRKAIARLLGGASADGNRRSRDPPRVSLESFNPMSL